MNIATFVRTVLFIEHFWCLLLTEKTFYSIFGLILYYGKACLGFLPFFRGKVRGELRVTNYEFKSTSYELISTSYEFKSTNYEFKFTSYEFKFTSYKFKFTSYEFKFTSLASVSLKPHTKILKNLFHNMALKNIYVTPKLPTYFSIGHKIRTY